jgi:peptide subunit release factor 1 (eRF1)
MMGEYADMIINGETCQYCMSEYPDEPVGYPWTCRDCKSEMTKGTKPKPQAAKVKCPECGKKVKEVGLADHVNDVHKALDREHHLARNDDG